jgi:hypothetical protein
MESIAGKELEVDYGRFLITRLSIYVIIKLGIKA